ncbi:EamA family transporter RarD [Peribacillus kribbensis]|uniref:EamA family transporter RarD n=1 Tax=Peribacillus kribbensis TaxID=356658 RepID=UPI0003FC0EF0|nr:EamA family transporter RarD [Peribacillus kribbensis]
MSRFKENEGVFYAALSYVIWGIVPIYWKWIQDVPAVEILAHRVFWSFIFMVILLLCTRKWRAFTSYFREIVKQPRRLAALLAASVLVSANWGIFIWAVNSGRILETSLGYYINPLVSVLLGVAVLKEKLTLVQIISFVLAVAGVLILTIHYGNIPWVSLLLAVTFGLYGLAKKMISADSAVGLTLETFMVTPLALGYMVYIGAESKAMFFTTPAHSLLLAGGGVITALPLLYFAKGAQKVPLSMLGFLQYIAPTLTLILGVFVYHETFTKTHLVAFIFIWSALTLYTLSKAKWKKPSVKGKGKKELSA